MPTGYTASVSDGKVTEFNEYAMNCARAFGALISMRDDPSDAEIPAEFAPSDYHVKALADAKERLAQLQAMTIDQRKIAADAAHNEEVASWDRREAEKKTTRERYQAMLEKVSAWAPPTSEHAELKNFMQSQLLQSIDFDCGPAYSARPTPVKRDDWHAKAVEQATRDVEYHTVENQKAIDRAAGRTAWIAALRQSLSDSK